MNAATDAGSERRTGKSAESRTCPSSLSITTSPRYQAAESCAQDTTRNTAGDRVVTLRILQSNFAYFVPVKNDSSVEGSTFDIAGQIGSCSFQQLAVPSATMLQNTDADG
jgi:hypothetical protein